MPFQIPEDVTVLTTKALRDFALSAAAEYESIKDSVTEETVTDEQLDEMDTYSSFMLIVDDELTARANRASRFRQQNEEGEESEEEETPGEFAETEEPEVPTPTLAQINAVAPSSETTDAIPAPKMFSFIAAPETGFAAGTELSGWDDIVKAFEVRSRSHVRGAPTQQHQFASIKREFGEFDVLSTDSDMEQMRKIDLVRDESQADGGSLLAGVGWCAPSETIYTTCNQVTTSGMFKVPEIGARRGGIRHNQGIRWSDIYGTGTGFNILTEEQVIADTVKTCVPVNCPPFVDDRLKVAVLCITGDILQDRAYPEYVKEFIRGAVATQAHNVNRQIIADIVTGSTAVTLTGAAPWVTDASVVSQLMSAMDMAAIDERYNLRLDPDATLEVVLPLWVKQAYRADWLRRNAADDPNMVDSMVSAMFATRNLSVQYVYDWQDAFSTGASGGTAFGGTNAMLSPPTSVSFLMYPAGTWVIARQDVIRLDTIYDSTNITTNKVTELFVEDGFRAMRFCPLSRVYTINICASGSTGVQRIVTC